MNNIIITGAASGVGKAVAKELINENLILLDIDKENLRQTATELEKDFYVCNLTDCDSIKNIIDTIKDKYDNINHKICPFLTQKNINFI